MKSLSSFLVLTSLLLLFFSREQTRAAESANGNSRYEIPATDEGLPGAGPIRRYDWFRKLWAQKRSAWAQRVNDDKGALVFLGDSITQGWGDNIGGSFPRVKVANRGI